MISSLWHFVAATLLSPHKASDKLVVLSEEPDPWGKEVDILLRLEQGKTRADIKDPKRLQLLCLPSSEDAKPAKILRERCKGKFAHSCEPTLLFFTFPVEGDRGTGWLTYSIVDIEVPLYEL